MTDALYNTKVADIVVPEIFTPYVQQISEQKSRLIQSGAMVMNPSLSAMLSGGGLTFNVPSFKDLDDDTENIPTDATQDTFAHVLSGAAINLDGSFSALSDSRPKATGTATEIAVRLNRNQSWASAQLAAQLAGADPMASIASRVGEYWAKRQQAALIATMGGIIKDNAANDSADYAVDIAAAGYTEGLTTFSAEAVIDTLATIGDSADGLAMVMMHSVVFSRAQKNNLIDFIPDSEGRITIPTFLGRRVIVDDGMPSGTSTWRSSNVAGTSGCYETWFFGPGAIQFGSLPPPNATAVERSEKAGNGGGQEVLYSRQQWILHPVGHAYIGTPANGGPSNAASSNNLNIAGSWNRVFSERKQIKFARLVSREA